jgi:hypothetical protein
VQSFPCPNCGAEVNFRSAALPAVVCAYCRTLVVRQGDGVMKLGTAAALPFDVSPIQIGTSGRFEGIGFDVVGRVRWGWTDGGWNEWVLFFADGSTAWLGEAMGQFMLQRERPMAEVHAKAIRALAKGEKVSVGTKAQVGDVALFVADAREARCIAAEGELPSRIPPGWTVYSVDFRSPSGACATLQRDEQEATFYMGRYVSLAELQPMNLRRIEGWSLPAYAA